MTYKEWLKLIAESFHVSYSVARKMFFAMVVAGKDDIVCNSSVEEKVITDAVDDYTNSF